MSFIPANGNPFGTFEGATTHSGPWSFLQHVPLLFYGPGAIKAQGQIELRREVTLADMTPTIARLIHTDAPSTATGKVLGRILKNHRRTPRLVITVVWDGGGMNVLEEWDHQWPFLRSLIDKGTFIGDATVGSTPSVTPAVHSTMGTGTFPKNHGVVSIEQRRDGRLVAAFPGHTPSNLEVPTLADVYDRSKGNRPLIGFFAKAGMHLGMIGHGAYMQGGDKDIAILVNADGKPLLETNPTFYSLPNYMQGVPGLRSAVKRVDRSDGKADGKWLDHPLPGIHDIRGMSKNPVLTIHQTKLLKVLLSNARFGKDKTPDLFYTNYKDIDHAGHAYNYMSPEVKVMVRYHDRALKSLVKFLDSNVGKRNYVLVMTADHGQSPHPIEAGTWPINVDQLEHDIENFIGSKAVINMKQNGLWLDTQKMKNSGKDNADVATFLMTYLLADNEGQRPIPNDYEKQLDEFMFQTAFPSRLVDGLVECSKQR